MDWAPWAVAVWYVWIAFGLVYEIIALLDPRDGIPPLTWVTIRYYPTLGVLFAAWLFVHFTRRALRRRAFLASIGLAPPQAPEEEGSVMWQWFTLLLRFQEWVGPILTLVREWALKIVLLTQPGQEVEIDDPAFEVRGVRYHIYAPGARLRLRRER